MSICNIIYSSILRSEIFFKFISCKVKCYGKSKRVKNIRISKEIFLEWQLFPNEDIYNLSLVYSIKGALNVDALKESFKILIDNNQILNSNFSEDGSCYFAGFHIDDIFLELEIDNKENKLEQIGELAYRPYDLTKDNLLRVYLLHDSYSKEYILVICAHHIVVDGVSLL